MMLLLTPGFPPENDAKQRLPVSVGGEADASGELDSAAEPPARERRRLDVTVGFCTPGNRRQLTEPSLARCYRSHSPPGSRPARERP